MRSSMNGCGGRTKEIDPFVNAIVAGGYSNDPILSDFAGHGFRDILKKPCSIRRLAEVVPSALRGPQKDR